MNDLWQDAVITEAVRKLNAIAMDLRDMDDIHEALNVEEVIDLLTEGEES